MISENKLRNKELALKENKKTYEVELQKQRSELADLNNKLVALLEEKERKRAIDSKSEIIQPNENMQTHKMRNEVVQLNIHSNNAFKSRSCYLSREDFIATLSQVDEKISNYILSESKQPTHESLIFFINNV